MANDVKVGMVESRGGAALGVALCLLNGNSNVLELVYLASEVIPVRRCHTCAALQCESCSGVHARCCGDDS